MFVDWRSLINDAVFLQINRFMNYLKSLLLSVSLLLTLLLPGYAFGQSPNIDVLHYAFHLELTDESNVIKGQTAATIKFTEDNVESFSLDLIGTEDSKKTGMRVASVTRDKEAMSFSHADDRLNITLPSPPAEGEEHTFTISYQGTPADGLFISENKYGDRTFFGDNWPNRARHWLPSNDHLSDKATMEFIITAPDHYQVISSGLMIEETDLMDGNRRTHWKTNIPIPTKVAVIGVAQFAIQHDEPYGNVPIQHWVYPQDREAGFHDFGVTHDMMKFFEDNIGPYSYEKLANVQSKTRYGGMENASNIFYSENSITGERSNEGLVAHEIAHQWFGNSATESDWQHIWLSEGFATYFTQLYMEHAYGRDRMIEGMKRAREAVLGFYERAPNLPLVNPAIEDPNQHLNRNSYQKGAWVLHMLRHNVGDDAFWAGIQQYYKAHRNANASSADLQKAMEAASGKDLDTFFQQWLYQPGQPMIEASWRYDKDKKELVLSLAQTQQGPLFNTPVELAMIGPDGRKSQTTFVLSKKQESISIPRDTAPASIELDPNTWLLTEITMKN